VEFRILGPLEVIDDEGRPIRLGGARQRALLAALLLHANEVVLLDRLMDELWGDRPPASGAKALQVAVSQLRKSLGNGALQTRSGGYVLHVDEEQLDLGHFGRLRETARSALAAGRAEEAAAALREALGLWRGRALADVAGEEFARGEAERLEELRLVALEERIEADLALGRHAELVAELESLVQRHPLRERLKLQLMLALYRSGRQAEALDVYRETRRLLAEELGIEPGPGLRELERAILRQDPELEFARAPNVVGGLPVGTVTFVFTDIEGSTRLVKTLRERWGDVLGAHRALVREMFARHGGHEVDTQGDAFFFSFSEARDAVAATVAAQSAIDAKEWPEGLRVRARMGVHTGQGTVDDSRYVGIAVHRAARICAAAHGGQILVSQSTRELLEDEELEPVAGEALRELGSYRLKDLDRSVRLYQVVAPGLQPEFPPIRAERHEARPRRRLLLGAALLAAAGAAAAVLVVLTRDASTPVVVRPNSVAVIDPATNDIVAAVRVGKSPGPIVNGLGSVWVLNKNDFTVSRIHPVERQVVGVVAGSVEVTGGREAQSVSLLAAGENALWIGNGAQVRRSEEGRAGHTTTIEFPEIALWSGIATGLGHVWVPSWDSRLLRIDPDRGTLAATVQLEPVDESTGLSSVAVGFRAVWVAVDEADGARVLRYDPVSGDVARVPVLGRPVAIAVGGASVWVTDSSGNRLVRIRPRPLSVVGSFPVGRGPAAVTVGAGAVWTANALDGTVSRVDPATGEVTTIRIGHRPQGIAFANGLVWVSVRS
jgi:DNA-binding SARP family transcriptional activator